MSSSKRKGDEQDDEALSSKRSKPMTDAEKRKNNFINSIPSYEVNLSRGLPDFIWKVDTDQRNLAVIEAQATLLSYMTEKQPAHNLADALDPPSGDEEEEEEDEEEEGKPYLSGDLKKYLNLLAGCVFDLGFNYESGQERRKLCCCPCSKQLENWRESEGIDIEDIHKCKGGWFNQNTLIDHLRTKGGGYKTVNNKEVPIKDRYHHVALVYLSKLYPHMNIVKPNNSKR